jgi:N-acetyl sugar amidotransferase
VDTTDPDIHFDEQGVCNHCYEYDRIAQERVFAGERGRQELECIVSQIKAEGQHKEYDCVIGVSGGVDSTFVAYTVKKLGLRPLAVHVDNGWDSELAVSNIEKFLKRLGIDLYTHVLDWEEFKDLQLSFLKASVPDAEVPTDHAIVAVLFQVTAERGIRYLLPGGNHATEGILPIRWAYGGSDWRYIKSIQQQFGTAALKTFPHFSLFDMFRYVFVNRARSIRILNYVPYNKSQAMQTLENELDWKYYGGKHYESIYTRFFQGYILPRKFNIDKRKAHLSSLICAGQMTRAEAIDTMRHNPYTEEMQQADREYVVKKLDLTDEGFEQIMQLPVKSFYDYPTYYPFLNRIRRWVSAAKQWGLLPRQNAAW